MAQNNDSPQRTFVLFTFALSALTLFAYPVLAANVYHDINPANETTLADVTGEVTFFDRACGSAEDLLIFISRDGTNVSPFDAYYHPDRTEVPDQNPGYLQVKILQDCKSAPERLTPGNFTSHMRNGNNGQPEEQHFIIAAKSSEVVPFIGHAVSSRHKYPATGNTLEIIRATWGTGQTCTRIWIEERNHTLHHNATTETIYHQEQNHTAYHGELNHTEWIEEVNHTVTHPEVSHLEYRTIRTDCYYLLEERWFWGDVWKVRCTNPEHHGWHIQTPECTERKATYGEWSRAVPESCAPAEGLATVIGCPTCRYETRTVIDEPARTEIVVDVPAHTVIVVDEPAWQELVVDVPAWVETRTITEPYDEIVVDVPGHWGTICRTGRYVDVTSIVKGLVKGGELHIKAVDYIRLFGDVEPGVGKMLTIEYRLNGADGLLAVDENTDVDIPEV